MMLDEVFLIDGNLRPIWRFFLSVVLIFLAYCFTFLLAQGMRPLIPQAGIWYEFFFLVLFLLLLGSFKVMTSLFERKPLAVVGLTFHPTWKKELCIGLGVGGIMMFAVGGAEALLGFAHFVRSPLAARTEFAFGSGLALILMTAATNEELAFRGYPFQRLVDSLGPVWAVIVSSLLFGLVHLGNPHHTLISTANTMLVGVPLCIAYLRTRALWMPVGIHFIWNYVQGFLFGLPVSGLTFPHPLLSAQVHGSGWLTGSAYGPEGGLLCTIVVVGAAIFLFLSPSIQMSERMKELVYGPSPDTATKAAAGVPPGLDLGDKGST
jgi:hypothetical protein